MNPVNHPFGVPTSTWAGPAPSPREHGPGAKVGRFSRSQRRKRAQRGSNGCRRVARPKRSRSARKKEFTLHGYPAAGCSKTSAGRPRQILPARARRSITRGIQRRSTDVPRQDPRATQGPGPCAPTGGTSSSLPGPCGSPRLDPRGKEFKEIETEVRPETDRPLSTASSPPHPALREALSRPEASAPRARPSSCR